MIISSDQQWTIGPIDGEIVPLYGEMLHPTQNHTYQGEMERKNIHIYMYPEMEPVTVGPVRYRSRISYRPVYQHR